ncbi:MAG: tRNA lysidine(34) synthetase TilS [Oscillospiraceae bacterium]|nr:tRNA lysidine(34) synthetase TilS [Oscillospiraceae bacterium]
MPNSNSDLWQKAENLIEKYNMINSGDDVLVAFSGGSDSSALLFFLLEFLGKKNNIFAAHLNHMIRGAESGRDEKFAVETCEKYKIKIFAERRDIPKMAKDSKKGIEEAARDARYVFLREVAGSIGKKTKIATAHTASDNAETVIFNLARGCGLNGLSGIAPVRENIVRPLLSCSKGDILSYCRANKIPYVEDATNSDENYSRNFIRRNITSKLGEKFNRSDENIFKTSETLRDFADFMDSLANAAIGSSGCVEAGALMTRHKALQHSVIEKLYEKAVFPENKKLERRHIEYVAQLLAKTEKSADLPGLVTAKISKNKLAMEKTIGKKTSRNRK